MGPYGIRGVFCDKHKTTSLLRSLTSIVTLYPDGTMPRNPKDDLGHHEVLRTKGGVCTTRSFLQIEKSFPNELKRVDQSCPPPCRILESWIDATIPPQLPLCFHRQVSRGVPDEDLSISDHSIEKYAVSQATLLHSFGLVSKAFSDL